MDQQEARVRLGVVLDPELDEHVVLDRDALDEELDDAVLAELREDLELRPFDLVRGELRHPPSMQAADLGLQRFVAHLSPERRALRQQAGRVSLSPSGPQPPFLLELVEKADDAANVVVGRPGAGRA